MKDLLAAVAILFAVIWTALSFFLKFITQDEKRESKDSSWKFSAAILIFSLMHAVVFGVFAYYLLASQQ